MKKSESSEDYMKSILILHKRNGAVRSAEVATEMGVSRPSVCNAMKKLRKENMIYFGENDHIYFTDAGKKLAEKIYSKHSLIARFLKGIGVSKDRADEEACVIEHAISDETYECLDKFYKAHMGYEEVMLIHTDDGLLMSKKEGKQLGLSGSMILTGRK